MLCVSFLLCFSFFAWTTIGSLFSSLPPVTTTKANKVRVNTEIAPDPAQIRQHCSLLRCSSIKGLIEVENQHLQGRADSGPEASAPQTSVLQTSVPQASISQASISQASISQASISQASAAHISSVDHQYTPSQLRRTNRRIDQASRRWRPTRNAIALIRLFQLLAQHSSHRIANAVIIALGTLRDRPRSTFGDNQSSLAIDWKQSIEQLGAFEVLFEILSGRWGISKQDVVFADPAFDDFDRAVLRSRGYTVLDDPDEAIGHIATTTFLYCTYPPMNVLMARLLIDQPSLYLGDSPQIFIDELRNNPYELYGPDLTEEDIVDIDRQAHLYIKHTTRFMAGKRHYDLTHDDEYPSLSGFTLVWTPERYQPPPPLPREEAMTDIIMMTFLAIK